MNQPTIATLFKALSDPIRVEVMGMLTVEKRCACQILEKLIITQPTLSHHMAVLVASGLVQSERRGKWVFYGIDPVAIEAMRTYLAELGTAALVCEVCGGVR